MSMLMRERDRWGGGERERERGYSTIVPDISVQYTDL